MFVFIAIKWQKVAALRLFYICNVLFNINEILYSVRVGGCQCGMELTEQASTAYQWEPKLLADMLQVALAAGRVSTIAVIG